MGGCWMGIVFGFGGLRLHREGLVFRPCLPEELDGYSFTMTYQGSRFRVDVNREDIHFALLDGPGLDIQVYDRQLRLTDALNLPLHG